MSYVVPTLYPVKGIQLGTAAAGIKVPDRDDLVLISLTENTKCAAVFTQNAFAAAPVIIAQRHLSKVYPRYVLINSGNANAGTGQQGLADSLSCCSTVAALSGLAVNKVLPFSTGVIGESLPVDTIQKNIAKAYANLSEDNWHRASKAIMTTDTVAKALSTKLDINGETVTITAIAKGAGMICPNMATMLAFIATDVHIEPALMDVCLKSTMERTFNCISVDGDTSTNDACILMTTGQSNIALSEKDAAYEKFAQGLYQICEQLAQAIIKDGEGATKLIKIAVEGGKDWEECKKVGYTVAHSPLVKTAFFASDPNWGRILAAVGRSGLPDFKIDDVYIYLDDYCIVSAGERINNYSESQAKTIMQKQEILVRIQLGRGREQAHLWTCDLSYDYVRINAEYRS